MLGPIFLFITDVKMEIAFSSQWCPNPASYVGGMGKLGNSLLLEMLPGSESEWKCIPKAQE